VEGLPLFQVPEPKKGVEEIQDTVRGKTDSLVSANQTTTPYFTKDARQCEVFIVGKEVLENDRFIAQTRIKFKNGLIPVRIHLSLKDDTITV